MQKEALGPLALGVTSSRFARLKRLLGGGVQQVRAVLRALTLLPLAKRVGAPNRRHHSAHPAGHPQGGTSISGRRFETGTL
jgi:hypothetical protein